MPEDRIEEWRTSWVEFVNWVEMKRSVVEGFVERRMCLWYS